MSVLFHNTYAMYNVSAQNGKTRCATDNIADIVKGSFRRLSSNPHYPPAIINNPSVAAGVSRRSVTEFRNFVLLSGIRAFRNLGNAKAANQFENMLEDEPDDDLLANDKDIMAMLALRETLVNALSANIKSSRQIHSKTARQEALDLVNQCSKDILNETEWNTIHCSFSILDKTFEDTLTPAGKIANGKNTVYAMGYDNKGICSKSCNETTHAVNLWVSQFTMRDNDKKPGESQRVLFTGIRHGVCSPYDLPAGSAERKAGALNRAKEIAIAALAMQPDKLAAAIKGEKVYLPLTSTSLLTPVDIGPCREKSQLKDQFSAWDELNSRPVVLALRNDKNEVVNVTLQLDIAAFNFGVNELALGRLGLGNTFSDKLNEKALVKLLGDNLSVRAEPGGWVGKYLAEGHANAPRVLALANELKHILASKSHHSDKGEPYKAAMRVALLSNEMGIMPCWNCKSGKDRTGIMDAEIKLELAGRHLHLNTGSSDNLNMTGQRLMQAVMLNSGNKEVQRYNTGVAGNKSLKKSWLVKFILGELSLRKRIGSEKIADWVKGLSHLV